MYLLELITFTSGAVIMVLELVGSRILAPYLGTSIFVWTSLIGVILASLSLGYFWGGKLADRTPTYRNLSLILFASGIALLLTAIMQEMILSGIQNALDSMRIGALVATTILFAPPSMLMAMVVPYVVRLKIVALHQSGATVGRLWSISTTGSIFGTFLAGFFLIAYMGSEKILYLLSAIMILMSLFAYYKGIRQIAILGVFVAPFLIGARNVTSMFGVNKVADVDTNYNRVAIIDEVDSTTGKEIRYMRVNDDSSSAAFKDSDDLYFPYTRYYKLADHFKKDIHRCLMLGGGAYSFPKYFLAHHTNAEIFVVEIDPALTRLAKHYFGLKDGPRLKIFHEDGRTFLNQARERYDVIFVDVFKSRFSLPPHLTTVEAVSKMRDLLNDDGFVMVNIISGLEGDRGEFLRAEYVTYRQKFEEVMLFAVQDPKNSSIVQNWMLAAFRKKPGAELLQMSDRAELQDFLRHRWVRPVPAGPPALTDDFAPVERYSMASLDANR